jgi:hypothetical protein
MMVIRREDVQTHDVHWDSACPSTSGARRSSDRAWPSVGFIARREDDYDAAGMCKTAQINPASSRAMATVTCGAGLSRARI